jgi:hypothetical protein
MKRGAASTLVSILFLVSSTKVNTRIDAFVLPSYANLPQTATISKCHPGKSYPHKSRIEVLDVQKLTSRQSQLYAKKDEQDPIEKDKGSDETTVSIPIAQKIVMIWKVLSTRFLNFLPSLRVAIASFTVGAVFALTVVFVPVYNSVDKMSEPVTLFETILTVSMVCSL